MSSLQEPLFANAITKQSIGLESPNDSTPVPSLDDERLECCKSDNHNVKQSDEKDET